MTDAAEAGCLKIIGWIALIVVAQQVLFSLLPIIIGGAFLGGIGFLFYRVVLYDNRTGNITSYIENLFNIPNSKKKTLQIPEKKTAALEAGQEEIDNKLELIKEKLDELEGKNHVLQEEQQEAIKNTIQQYEEKLTKKSEQKVLENLFGAPPMDYVKTDEFDRKDFAEQTKKKQKSLEIRELKQEVSEQLFVREKEAFEIRMEAKEDRAHIRMEMKDGFTRIDGLLVQLENKVITQRSYFEEKISKMQMDFSKEIGLVKENIANFKVEVANEFSSVRGEISDVKIQFGKEILRIDRAQMRIVQKLGEYENKLRQFSIETMRIKNQAERFQIRGQRVLDQAQVIYQKHRVEMQGMGKDLEIGLEKIALHKSDFALRAGQAKLQMDKISQDQYLELKNIGYAEIGVRMLRQDFEQREALKQQEMRNLISDRRRAEERLQELHSRGLETAHLRHRINILNEKYQYASHTNSIMQREHNVFKRLSKR